MGAETSFLVEAQAYPVAVAAAEWASWAGEVGEREEGRGSIQGEQMTDPSKRDLRLLRCQPLSSAPAYCLVL